MKAFHTEREVYIDIPDKESIKDERATESCLFTDERVKPNTIFQHSGNKEFYLSLKVVQVEEEVLVVYKPLYDSEHSLYARPLEMFVGLRKGEKRFKEIVNISKLYSEEELFKVNYPYSYSMPCHVTSTFNFDKLIANLDKLFFFRKKHNDLFFTSFEDGLIGNMLVRTEENEEYILVKENIYKLMSVSEFETFINELPTEVAENYGIEETLEYMKKENIHYVVYYIWDEIKDDSEEYPIFNKVRTFVNGEKIKILPKRDIIEGNF